jgi:hypothetical protein
MRYKPLHCSASVFLCLSLVPYIYVHAFSTSDIARIISRSVTIGPYPDNVRRREILAASSSYDAEEFDSDMDMDIETGIEIDDGEDDDMDMDIPIQSITDEEALLACRAYLQRRNKLPHDIGWRNQNARQQKLQKSLALSPNADEGAGYFWEDPTQLKYLFTGRPRLSFEDEDGNDVNWNQDGSDYNLDWMETDAASNGDEDEEEDEDIKDALIIEDEEESGLDAYFTGFPSFPPKSFTMRSKQKKALFQDPEWKEKWYEARWGKDFVEARAQERQAKKVEKYIQQIPSDILRSPELAALSEDDIDNAIRTYMVANKKRSVSRKRGLEKKRKMLRGNLLVKDEVVEKGEDGNFDTGTDDVDEASKTYSTLDAFMAQLEGDDASINALEEQRRKRSERAKKAYKTRLDNQNSEESLESHKEVKNVQTGRPLHQSLYMSEAMTRIQNAIESGDYPQSEDIEIILEPKRLAGRKNLLQEVLLKSFGMRGKCIPNLEVEMDQHEYEDVDLDDFYEQCSMADVEIMDKSFVTKSTVLEIGCYILFLLHEVENEDES